MDSVAYIEGEPCPAPRAGAVDKERRGVIGGTVAPSLCVSANGPEPGPEAVPNGLRLRPLTCSASVARLAQVTGQGLAEHRPLPVSAEEQGRRLARLLIGGIMTHPKPRSGAVGIEADRDRRRLLQRTAAPRE